MYAESGTGSIGTASWIQYNCLPVSKLHLLREPSEANERQWVPLSITLTDRTEAVEHRWANEKLCKLFLIGNIQYFRYYYLLSASNYKSTFCEMGKINLKGIIPDYN